MPEAIPDLVERFGDGDASAFAELVGRYHQKIYYLAYRILGSHLDADSATRFSRVLATQILRRFERHIQ